MSDGANIDLHLSEAAKLLGVSFPTIWRYAKAGKLGAVHGSPARVKLTAIERLRGPVPEDELAKVRWPKVRPSSCHADERERV